MPKIETVGISRRDRPATSSDSGAETDRKPSFLFVMQWDPNELGGVNYVVVNLWEQVNKNAEMRPLLMLPSWEHPRPAPSVVNGRRTIYWRMRMPWYGGFRESLIFLVTLPTALMRLRRLLRRERVVAVNVHYPSTSALVFVILRRLGLHRAKVILTFHSTDIWHAGRSRGFTRLIWKILMMGADVCTAVSEGLRQQVHALCPQCKSVAVLNALDVPAFLAERDPAFQLDPRLLGRRFILDVASFNFHKGHDLLIDAFAAISREFPDLLLVIVGQSGPYLPEMKRQVERHGLSERVLYFENVPHGHLLNFFESASLFVLPSRREGFGLVLLEAGVFAIPVVAADVGGIPEIIFHDRTGRLVPPDDLDALTREILDLLRHPAEAKRLGERLRRSVEDDFSWARAYRAYVNLTLP